MKYPFRLGKYEIFKLIGCGSVGRSYLAQDIHTKELVVIKIVENEDIWRCIKENESSLCSLDNESIMKTYGMGIIDGQKCIIQEYVKGDDLNTFIPNNDLLLEDFLNIAYGIFGAIEAMSKRGISHKDIKPSNIVYDKNKKIAKLVDLDYVYLYSSQTRHYIGTVKYSAPEQIIDNNTSDKADVYSFGLVMCFMISGGISFDPDLKRFGHQTKEDVGTCLKKNPNLNKNICDRLLSLIIGSLEYLPGKRVLPAEARRNIEDLKRICDAENQNSIVIHEHINRCGYISDDLTFLASSALESSAIFLESISLSPIPSTVETFEKRTDDEKANNLIDDPRESDNNRTELKNFYRGQLLKEYANILVQAKVSFILWVTSFVVCFLIIGVSIYSILNGKYIEGAITTVLDGAIIAIQKLFSIREDYYRGLMEQKMKHLETGDYLDYAFEKVEKIDSPADKDKEVLELIKTIREHAKQDANNV